MPSAPRTPGAALPTRRATLRRLAGGAAALAGTWALPAAAQSQARRPLAGYGQHPAVAIFVDELAQRHGWPAPWLRAAFAQVAPNAAVQRLILPPPPGTARNWAAYRARFVEPQRVAVGVAFWQAHARWFARAEAETGVPAALVAGILGVETYYGRMTGNFRVLEALATLAFDYPPAPRDRSAYFRSELEAFLAWCQAEGRDPAAPRGSFAGAFGLPQFMPSNITRHGVDFDGDGRVDLLASPADAIGSVAAYLAAHGWQRGMPTHYGVAVPVDNTDRAHLLGPDIVPSFTAAEFGARGAALEPPGDRHDGLLALVELQNGERAPSFVAGTQNFWAVTRYNRSSYYALAVIDLGSAVAAARAAGS